MKVLQVHNRYRLRGGEDVVVESEATLLRGAGHEVVRVGVENPEGKVAAMSALASAPWNRRAAAAVRAAAVRHQPDVAHVHNTWFTLTPAVLPALRAAGVPVVLTLHNYRLVCANSLLYRDGRPCEDCVGSHPWHGVVHACYRGSRLQSVPAAATIALNRRRGTWTDGVSLFIALTEFARGRFVAAGLPADRIRVKPHVVDDPGPRRTPPSTSRTVLVVGRLSYEKGLDLLLRAAAQVTAPLDVVVVGEGPERERLEAIAGDDVTFLGWQSAAEVRRLMLEARALCFPSQLYETFGLSMVEALAAGLPVIASDIGGTPSIVDHQVGALVRHDDVTAWRDALEDIATRDDVDELSEAARARWAARYSPARGLAALEEIYAEAQTIAVVPGG